jgi:hypothetical protein
MSFERIVTILFLVLAPVAVGIGWVGGDHLEKQRILTSALTVVDSVIHHSIVEAVPDK